MEFFIVSDFPNRNPRCLAGPENAMTSAYCRLSSAHETIGVYDVVLAPGESVLAIKHGEGELLTYVSDGEIDHYYRDSIFGEDRCFATIRTDEAYARLHPDNHAYFLVNPSPSKPARARVVEFATMTDAELRHRIERELAWARSIETGKSLGDGRGWAEPDGNSGLKLLASSDWRGRSARLSSASVYFASLREGEVAEFRPMPGCTGLIFPLQGAVWLDGGTWSSRPPYFVSQHQAVVLTGMVDKSEVIVFEEGMGCNAEISGTTSERCVA